MLTEETKMFIYDFDGVICDSVDVKTNAFIELYKSYGRDIVNKVVEYHLEHGGISRFEKIKYYHRELLKVEITEQEVNTLANKFSSIALQKVIDSPFISGALEYLERNSLITTQVICTGTPDAEIKEILKRKKIDHLFQDVYGSPSTKADSIQSVIAKYKLSPSECIFFGDAMTDYKAAFETKVPFIGIKNPRTVFPKGTYVVNDFNQLI